MRALFSLALAMLFWFAPELQAVKHIVHPPEVHVGHGPEPFGPRVGWMIAGAIMAYTVFRCGEALCKRFANPHGKAESEWGWRGGWIRLDGLAQLVVPFDSTAAWVLFRGIQCLELVPSKADASAGTAEGFVVCATGRHVINRFTVRPWPEDVNKLEITFNNSEVVGIFKRPE